MERHVSCRYCIWLEVEGYVSGKFLFCHERLIKLPSKVLVFVFVCVCVCVLNNENIKCGLLCSGQRHQKEVIDKSS